MTCDTLDAQIGPAPEFKLALYLVYTHDLATNILTLRVRTCLWMVRLSQTSQLILSSVGLKITGDIQLGETSDLEVY